MRKNVTKTQVATNQTSMTLSAVTKACLEIILFLGLTSCGALAPYEPVEGNPVNFGEPHEDAYIGDSLPPFPFGNGFIGIVQKFCELHLRELGFRPQLHKIFRNNLFQIVHRHILTRYAEKDK